MNIKLFRWDRALDLAKQYKQHVDTVLWYRRRYLLAAQAEETSQRFITEAVSAGGAVGQGSAGQDGKKREQDLEAPGNKCQKINSAGCRRRASAPSQRR